MAQRLCITGAFAAAALSLAACTTPQPTDYPGGSASSYPSTSYPSGNYSQYGYVESIEVVPATQTGVGGVGVGAIGGAIAGGVLGNQVGHGAGRAAATVGGAVAGGVIGNEIEKRVGDNHQQQYRFRLRMDDGSYQTYTQDATNDVRVGDRVRVENGRVYRS
jgi:outer membrane lipoprotein SlyB